VDLRLFGDSGRVLRLITALLFGWCFSRKTDATCLQKIKKNYSYSATEMIKVFFNPAFVTFVTGPKNLPLV
jgi:hypothetical protein